MVRGVVALIVAALTFGATAAAAPKAARAGALLGETQISFGCPGPTREGDLSCQPWHAYPHARVRLIRLDGSRAPLAGTARVVTSNAQGRFRLVVRVGLYRLTPLPQANTHGGQSVIVRVSRLPPTRVLVRFIGFPQMV